MLNQQQNILNINFSNFFFKAVIRIFKTTAGKQDHTCLGPGCTIETDVEQTRYTADKFWSASNIIREMKSADILQETNES